MYIRLLLAIQLGSLIVAVGASFGPIMHPGPFFKGPMGHWGPPLLHPGPHFHHGIPPKFAPAFGHPMPFDPHFDPHFHHYAKKMMGHGLPHPLHHPHGAVGPVSPLHPALKHKLMKGHAMPMVPNPVNPEAKRRVIILKRKPGVPIVKQAGPVPFSKYGYGVMHRERFDDFPRFQFGTQGGYFPEARGGPELRNNMQNSLRSGQWQRNQDFGHFQNPENAYWRNTRRNDIVNLNSDRSDFSRNTAFLRNGGQLNNPINMNMQVNPVQMNMAESYDQAINLNRGRADLNNGFDTSQISINGAGGNERSIDVPNPINIVPNGVGVSVESARNSNGLGTFDRNFDRRNNGDRNNIPDIISGDRNNRNNPNLNMNRERQNNNDRNNRNNNDDLSTRNRNNNLNDNRNRNDNNNRNNNRNDNKNIDINRNDNNNLNNNRNDNRNRNDNNNRNNNRNDNKNIDINRNDNNNLNNNRNDNRNRNDNNNRNNNRNDNKNIDINRNDNNNLNNNRNDNRNHNNNNNNLNNNRNDNRNSNNNNLNNNRNDNRNDNSNLNNNRNDNVRLNTDLSKNRNNNGDGELNNGNRDNNDNRNFGKLQMQETVDKRKRLRLGFSGQGVGQGGLAGATLDFTSLNGQSQTQVDVYPASPADSQPTTNLKPEAPIDTPATPDAGAAPILDPRKVDDPRVKGSLDKTPGNVGLSNPPNGGVGEKASPLDLTDTVVPSFPAGSWNINSNLGGSVIDLRSNTVQSDPVPLVGPLLSKPKGPSQLEDIVKVVPLETSLEQTQMEPSNLLGVAEQNVMASDIGIDISLNTAGKETDFSPLNSASNSHSGHGLSRTPVDTMGPEFQLLADAGLGDVGSVDVLTLDSSHFASLEQALQSGTPLTADVLDLIIGKNASSSFANEMSIPGTQVIILDGTNMDGSLSVAELGLSGTDFLLGDAHHAASIPHIPQAESVLNRAHPPHDPVGVVGDAVGSIPAPEGSEVLGIFSMQPGSLEFPNVPASVSSIPSSISKMMHRSKGSHAAHTIHR